MVLASKLPLPDECIDLIVAYLVDERQALHALVLSSQKLFQRTVPVLYRSPFQLIEQSHRWTRDQKEERSAALLALLLSSKASSLTALSIKSSRPIVSHRHQQLRPPTLDYLRFYTLQYHVDLLGPLAILQHLTYEKHMYILDVSKSMTELQNDVAMSLVEYRPEDIKVIGQPIARAPLVLVPLLQRLRNLVRLELSEIPYGCKLEPILEFIRVHDATHHTLKEIKIKGSEDLNRHLIPTHSQLVRLIQAMQTPQVVDARHWREAILVLDQIPVDCLRTLLLGMADIPPNNISVVDYLSLCTCLEELRMPIRDEKLFAWAVEERQKMGLDRNGSALPRSRSLPPPLITTTTTITATSNMTSDSVYLAPSHHPTSGITGRSSPFLMPSSASATSSSISLLSPSPWQLRHHYHPEWHAFEQQHGLARLKSIELCGEDRCLIPALSDATDAFRDSLECLKAQSLAILMTTAPILNFMPLTWSWPLPRLTILDLEGEVASAFDFAALRYCPALLTLRLSLPPYMYSTSEDGHILVEMTARMSQICLATNLLDLELQGKWPVSDELLGMMARQMRRLTKIYIVSCSEYTTEGVQVLVRELKHLKSLAISRWLYKLQPTRLQVIKSLNPQLELVEE
ncbi:hypothetical protein BC939DRAFT_465741 [Gamsiella multidivaricata]|uniref:uncharacterized protein n=1 Tax=Gamsiella multidivaricata TaxID=101098 RepID=UPI00221F72FB|nr:uncharacterized protein BC939DRAFT_465741 [Gamsiella multidivaricata]KAI7817472.1 hypothetical protein BC939DRAFT_465741 [Gamsiella multidivaricata]